MNQQQQAGEVRMIPVNQIEVINPRERNNRVFNEIVGNIRAIGLKKANQGHAACYSRWRREVSACVRRGSPEGFPFTRRDNHSGDGGECQR